MANVWSLPEKRILRRTCRSSSGGEYFVYVPSGGGHLAPLVVTVHGISRNAQDHAALFASYCENHRAVLVAPHFPEDRFADYQRLGRTGLGDRADVALDAIIREVASLTSAATARMYLFGYSGGAQFAHRYAMAHPQRVNRLVLSAAGWYTFPDTSKPFPYGIQPSPRLPGVNFDLEEFLRIPIWIFVGERDDESANPRRSKRIDRQQGSTRVERARKWVAAMKSAAEAYGFDSLVSYHEVAAIDHDFERFMKLNALGDRTFEAFFAPPVDGSEEYARGER